MNKNLNKVRARRARRVRAKILGTKDRPRLSIFRSNQHMYAQLIDDAEGKTIISASTKSSSGKTKTSGKVNEAVGLGKVVSEKAKQVGIKTAVLDRGKYAYHGRVKAIAETLRQEGIKI
jgi:large subunit ribosomal protein L18